ncbi:pyrimidine reductase family protein [Jiangella alkaliphila]|uniref:Pyrimidine reductase, riboflavin biosynthesis n=1 Tax=Jiangella alkaliphila TaxID=419479 RepID=A0A1H2KZG7_9ACTN|nr:pyrimidine reductase family protein [Jiangella alkaliphila]SDU74079.1 Pyrimidine reductase, riboflavin biosynthesis [Jiangella alkaliphila]
MQQLYPPGDAVDLDAAYAYPPLDGGATWLRANMVTSLDGAVQGPDGRSATVSSPPDRVVLSLLRRLADVVLAGAGTVRAEHYGPAQRPIAVASRSLDLDPAAPLFTEATHQTIVLTCASSPADRQAALREVADVVVAGETTLDVPAAVRALAERGLTRILCEGGPHLLAAIVAADALDELCYTLTPSMVGGRSHRLLEAPSTLRSDWSLGHLIEDGDTLLMRWVARRS